MNIQTRPPIATREPTNPLADTVADSLRHNVTFIDDVLWLTLGECTIRCESNNAALLTTLTKYFAPFIGHDKKADIHVQLIEKEPLLPNFTFQDWVREPGKTGRKDSFVDLPDGRLLRKVRTGMIFLQSTDALIASGPCLLNDNQVINFINAQYMNWLQQRNWLICHAAAASVNHQGVAICGFSGGGKSTLMLRLLDDPNVQFVSNDRLFLQIKNQQVLAAGVAKLPRINPGTALNNPRLASLIPASQHAALNNLPKQELWELEDKYDVIIDDLYGKGRIQLQTPLSSLLILNWDRHSNAPTQIRPVDITQRTDLLPAVMKSPGPFFHDQNGRFLAAPELPSEQRYIDLLSQVNVFEASGGIDFDQAKQQLLELIA